MVTLLHRSTSHNNLINRDENQLDKEANEASDDESKASFDAHFGELFSVRL